jgi:hypothetical protein
VIVIGKKFEVCVLTQVAVATVSLKAYEDEDVVLFTGRGDGPNTNIVLSRRPLSVFLELIPPSTAS